MTQPPTLPSKKSNLLPTCLIGCAIMAVLAVGLAIAAVFAGKYFIENKIAAYTSDKPIELPPSTLPEEQRAAAEQRFEQFLEAAKTGGQETILKLTGDELDAIVQQHLEAEEIPGTIRVQIVDDKLQGQVSLAADEIGIAAIFPGAAGRYINADVTFSASVTQGRLMIFLDSAVINGEPVPEQYLMGIREENLAKDMQSDPALREALENVSSLEIKDGKMILQLKGGTV